MVNERQTIDEIFREFTRRDIKDFAFKEEVKKARRALYRSIVEDGRWPHGVMPEYWHKGVDSCKSALVKILGVK